MGTRFIPRGHHKLSPQRFLFLFFASLALLACGILDVGLEEKTTPVSSDPMATVAALARDNAHLATRVGALVGENARQATQLAALATESAQQATQGAALATESARQATAVAMLTGSTTTESWQWAPAGSMTAARYWHTATLLPDRRVLLVAGLAGPDVSLSSAEIYDPVSGTFRATLSLNTARHQHSATLLLDGRVLVIAGYNPHDGWLSSAEIYDPATGQWSITQPVFAHGVAHTATLLEDGRVLVMGGASQSGSAGPDDRVEIFDPKTNHWQKAALHENTEASHTATLLRDGRVLIAGGNADPAIYDPANDTWLPAGKLAVERYFARAILLQDARVLLIGGALAPGADRVLNSVELYDPASDTWQQAASMAQARWDHTATLLPDGRVLVTGGAQVWDWTSWDQPGVILSSVEIYDPVNDTWSAGPQLQQARVGHTATLLPDGRVFVAGGRAAINWYLDSTEILRPSGR
jgi:N-acetylneuraminic acid mutarotase